MSIDGHISVPLPLEAGVPQGSILGPLLYILFTNELPDLIRTDESGSIVCYADDSTVSLHHSDPSILKRMVDEKYQIIAEYMAMNKLKLNSSKTHLLVLRTREAHSRDVTSGIMLFTGSETIEPSAQGKLLGVCISQDLTWDQHIRLNDNSAMKILTSRINALSRISKFSCFKKRKMIAEGIFISSLIYMIQLWGGANNALISSLQVLQNKAARCVTKLELRTPVKTLLQQTGWLSVRQLIVFYNCLLIYKVKLEEKLAYLYKPFGLKTDLCEQNSIC